MQYGSTEKFIHTPPLEEFGEMSGIKISKTTTARSCHIDETTDFTIEALNHFFIALMHVHCEPTNIFLYILLARVFNTTRTSYCLLFC
jgi:hypothetical protein